MKTEDKREKQMVEAQTEDYIFHRVLKQKWQQIERGEGVYLFDTEGNRYIDACAGVHVVSIGHGVKEIADAMHEQASQVCFTYSRFLTQPQIDLAQKIDNLAPDGLSKVFFVSGGSEATEAAMKMARKYHLETGNPKKYKVISRWQSWHGNTIGALSMSGRTPWREDYIPYLLDFPHIPAPYCYRCPYGKEYPDCHLTCAEELERVIHQEGSEYISAFIAEPILGTSAAAVAPPPDYYPIIREICDRHNIVMIVDEVVTGFGRTGVNFAIEHWDVVPDIMTTGKGLSSGYTPIAATIAHEKIYDAIYNKSNAFVHGHTYGGNPLSCAVALAVQNYIEKHDLVSQCAQMGDLMLEKLAPLQELPIVAEVRGKGLLIGVEFVADKEKRTPFDPSKGVTSMAVDLAFESGVLVMPGAPGLVDGVAGDHIAISPPFTVTESEVLEIVDVLTDTIAELSNRLGY
ncbi:MAG: aminotransferase class III-fold pyridoxal phosphate-dependent enzyme [Candidatus Poribacteria bacterium]|nr:aminotransferase class III-fold pyridoxal phosphate-dependent enzyme [Candidatus Poribacteria bacterium]